MVHFLRKLGDCFHHLFAPLFHTTFLFPCTVWRICSDRFLHLVLLLLVLLLVAVVVICHDVSSCSKDTLLLHGAYGFLRCFCRQRNLYRDSGMFLWNLTIFSAVCLFLEKSHWAAIYLVRIATMEISEKILKIVTDRGQPVRVGALVAK